MIYLTPNTTSSFCLTLSENTTYTGSSYILELENCQSLNKTYYTITDISLHTERYNEFQLVTELSGGYYDYKVTTSGSTTELERGKCLVKFTTPTTSSYSPTIHTYTYNPK